MQLRQIRPLRGMNLGLTSFSHQISIAQNTFRRNEDGVGVEDPSILMTQSLTNTLITMDMSVASVKVLQQDVSATSEEDSSSKAETCSKPTASEANAASLANQRLRLALFVFSCIYTILFVGSFSGWGPMQLIVSEYEL